MLGFSGFLKAYTKKRSYQTYSFVYTGIGNVPAVLVGSGWSRLVLPDQRFTNGKHLKYPTVALEGSYKIGYNLYFLKQYQSLLCTDCQLQNKIQPDNTLWGPKPISWFKILGFILGESFYHFWQMGLLWSWKFKGRVLHKKNLLERLVLRC